MLHERLKIDQRRSIYVEAFMEIGKHCKSEGLGVGAVQRLLSVLLGGKESAER